MSWIDQDDSEDHVKSVIQGATGYGLGNEAWQGWGGETDRLNQIAAGFSLPGLYHGQPGSEARSRINAIIDALGIPTGVDAYWDFLNGRYFGPTPTDTHATDILALSSTGYGTFGPNVPPITDLGLLTTVTEVNQQTHAIPDANWSFNGSTLASSAEPSPDRGNSAVLITDNGSGTVGGRISVQAPPVSGLVAGSIIMSCHFKAGLSNWVWMRSAAFDVADDAFFNLATGEVGTVDAAIEDAGIDHIADGWYRCWIKFTSTTNLAGRVLFGPSHADNTFPSEADGSLGVYAWGAGLKNGSFATDPIITEGSAVTRPGNMPVVPVPDGSRAFVLDMDLLEPLAGINGRRLLQWSGGDNSNGFEVAMAADGSFNLGVRRGGSYIGNSFGGAMNSGRNIFYGIVADDYVRSGATHVGDGVLRTDLGELPSIGQLNYGRRPDSDSANTYMRSRQFAEFRNIADPEAAFAQAKALAQEWAAQ